MEGVVCGWDGGGGVVVVVVVPCMMHGGCDVCIE
jgi:hypothetical protein